MLKNIKIKLCKKPMFKIITLDPTLFEGYFENNNLIMKTIEQKSFIYQNGKITLLEPIQFGFEEDTPNYVIIEETDIQNHSYGYSRFYDISKISFENGFQVLYIIPDEWANVGPVKNLLSSNYFEFQRANFFPQFVYDFNKSRIGVAEDIASVDFKQPIIEDLTLMDTGTADYGKMSIVAQFCIKNAQSNFNDSSFSNYIRTYLFKCEELFQNFDLRMLNGAVQILQRVNSYYGNFERPDKDPINLELIKGYVLPYEMVKKAFGTEPFEFGSPLQRKLKGYECIDTTGGGIIFENQLKFNYKNIDLNYKYYAGTLGNSFPIPRKKSYEDYFPLKLKWVISQDVFRISLFVEEEEHDLTDEFSISVTTNSKALNDEERTARQLGIIGSYISLTGSLASVANGNFAGIGGAVKNSQDILNYGKTQQGANASPCGAYTGTYARYFEDNRNTTYTEITNEDLTTNFMCPIKIIKYRSKELESKKAQEQGLIFNNAIGYIYGNDGELYKEKPVKYKFIQGKLRIKPGYISTGISNEALNKIQSDLQNGIYLLIFSM